MTNYQYFHLPVQNFSNLSRSCQTKQKYYTRKINNQLLRSKTANLQRVNKPIMLKEKSDNKKVYSETSVRKSIPGESGGLSARHQTQKSGLIFQNRYLKLLDKKCSRSMNDLSSHSKIETCSKRSNTLLSANKENIYPTDFNEEIINDEYRHPHKNRTASIRIFNVLMLNAWRKQKIGYTQSLEKIKGLSGELEGFKMQVYVLRQLLNAEKKRMESANDTIHELLQKVEDSKKEKSEMQKDREELQTNFNNLSEYCRQIENALKNQENDIITSRLEAENWERQLEKEREKLKKLESEENFLKEKVRLNEKVITLKSQQVDQLMEANEELQQKLDNQVPFWDETMAQVDQANAKLKECEMIKEELQKALEERDKDIKEMKATIVLLKKKLQEEDEKNGLLGKSVLEKSNELALVEAKLQELSKNNYPWSGGIIKMASLCAKIPVACICTVGSLLLPFPSYRI